MNIGLSTSTPLPAGAAGLLLLDIIHLPPRPSRTVEKKIKEQTNIHSIPLKFLHRRKGEISKTGKEEERERGKNRLWALGSALRTPLPLFFTFLSICYL